MAPVPLDAGVNYLSTGIVTAHIATVIYLVSKIGRGLYGSWKSLSPAQDIRARLASRTKLVPVFAALAALSFILATTSAAQYVLLSYRVWADQRGILVPERPTLSTSPTVDGAEPARLYIARWLSDTSIYHDALEIVAEKARRFWWGQQIDLGLISWSLLLGIEGHRRKIPYLGAYLALAHLVNLSTAQNLFYLALLLTPAPINEADQLPSGRLGRLRDAVFTPKPANWCPNPSVFLVALLANYGAVFLLPYAAETASFGTVMLSTRALSFLILAIPTIVPATWGTVHVHPHDVYSAYHTLFRVSSAASLLLHAKATLAALTFNTPDAHYHRHSIRIPFDTAERSAWERSTGAIAKVLGSTSDHPVVAAVGRDVVLSALSLGIWAAVRALDSGDILLSAIPFYKSHHSSLADDIAEFASDKADAVAKRTKGPSTPSTSISASETGTVRRGRSAKATPETPSVAASSAGEETGTVRRRGRPRKVKQEEHDLEEVPGDETYQPTPAQEVQAVEGDSLPAEDLDWEAAALAWGLTAAGGLGCGSAGVFGGECISR